MILSFVPQTTSKNTSEPLNTILENKNNEHFISLDSVGYNIHNNKKSKSNTNDTLNNARKIKLKKYDSLQMKILNECTPSIPTKKKADISDKINSSQDTISKQNATFVI